ncbi:MAG: efflux RND transporter periplasmic adaptor subunit [Calditrichia bacterium]
MANGKSKKRLVFWVIIIVLLLSGAIILLKGKGDQPRERKTVKVSKMTIIEKALAVGAIEPVNEIEVKAKVSGVVGRLYADVGDWVEAGQPLLEVKPDPTPLELVERKRELEMLQVELQTLEKELKRSEKLREKGLISQQQYESEIQKYKSAEIRFKTARERLDLLEKGKVGMSGHKIETVVKAPLTGYVLEKMVNIGDPIVPLTSYQPGTPLMRLADMNQLIFRGTVDEIDVGKIREGMTAEIKIGALPDAVVRGKVTLISLKAKKEENSTVFPVEIVITESENALLRAGYSANANIIIAQRDSVPAIPERVVTFRNDSAFVQIPLGENGSEERFIQTGLSDAINVEVLAGLQVGDEVLEKEVVAIK